MIRIFKNLEEYNTFTNNGRDLVSGDLYWVKENKRAFFLTNNIDGEVKSYDMLTDGIPEEYIIPSGNIEITENGEGIDVTQYATASVNVPIPDGYIVPSGNIAITENGEGIDVTNYATATVNVPSTGGVNEDLRNFIHGYITTLTIPNGMTQIGAEVFKNYTRPQSVIIPDSVKTIDMYAFSGCTSLTDVTIGSGVTKISYFAFQNCSSLTSITILAATPPKVYSNTFDNTNNCPIYVPAASVDAYKAATNWTAYASRIQAIGEEAGGDDIL